MSGDDLRMALSRAHAGWRMTNIGDISCDPEVGSLLALYRGVLNKLGWS